ncbi:UDP-N-acetylmuramyl-tripeptide synthetase [Candidatus Campbellbacteria bacterium]|nr:MAG: UDP-N-acetylmuramyl-tripeptide synthetase [Candidatus Campbellbacteria bacterium]
MLNTILRFIKQFIPSQLFQKLQPTYHYLLSLVGAVIYRFPSRHIHVVGITGTKGKSSTAELVNAVLEASGHKTAVLGTIRFKIADTETRNLYKMTMPGRFFVQKFLRDAVNAQCDWAIIEMTSEGAKQFRQKWIDMDALIFTNLAPEHLESHGSFEKYKDAKLSIARQLARSHKKNTAIIANADDLEGHLFLECGADRAIPFRLTDAKPYTQTTSGYEFGFEGTRIHLSIPGLFNVYNALAAAAFARSQNILARHIKEGLEHVTRIPGRAEFIREGQAFDVVVDYAHTPDSLKSVYEAFSLARVIGVLGNTGGGRDTWKRPEMARIAERSCEHIILTNEDPYDEDPEKILEEMSAGIQDKTKLSIILDRRQALREALNMAQTMSSANTRQRVVVLITGKGTDPFIMGPNGSKQAWDDATVVREELQNSLNQPPNSNP